MLTTCSAAALTEFNYIYVLSVERIQQSFLPENYEVLCSTPPASPRFEARKWQLPSCVPGIGEVSYVLYGPLVAMLLLLRYASPSWEEQSKQDQWCLIHLLTLCALRALTYQLWYSFSSMLFLVRRRQILKDGVDFKQIDQEWHWDDFLIFHCLLGVAAFYIFPSLRSLPSWDPKGLLISLPLHALVSEPLFYCIHRALHRPRLFKHYHSLHHSSRVPQPFTAGFATPMEHLLLCLVMGVPLAGAFLAGTGSVGLVYGYVLAFDFMRSMGYCNVEVFPQWVFETLPLLRYLIYTPTYHTIHHTGKNSNFCLFMPLFDLLGGTLHDNSWHLQKEISSGNIEQVPNFVFLGHVVDVIASTHAPFFSRSFSSVPFSPKPYILLWWPAAFVNLLQMWLWSKTFLFSLYTLRGRLHQFWVVPRCGFHYLLPFATKWINNEIEQAILSADRLGVEVLSLGGLNKNEALNGGGTLFVNKHRNLRVRIVHGNTLTAAALLNEIPKGVTEVFLTGATSKLGRAIALYLCQKGIRVLMLTWSTERFENIQKESPPECQQYLTHVTDYQAGQNCKTWIVGKWMSARQQQAAPPGTHFHQFAVPPISSSRRDCTYGKLAAMRLPSDVQGLGTCEHMLERGAVHACHAGGVVHLLEGWSHHEVGAIDVGQIDVVWHAALKHGLTPVYHVSPH